MDMILPGLGAAYEQSDYVEVVMTGANMSAVDCMWGNLLCLILCAYFLSFPSL